MDNNSGFASRPEQEEPVTYDGMRVEVFDEARRLLFEATVKNIDSRLILLERTSDLYVDDIGEITPVRLRGFHFQENRGVYLSGQLIRLAQVQDQAWMVENLTFEGMDNGRTFTRKPIRARGWIQIADTDENGTAVGEADTGGAWTECVVNDASAGGVRFRCKEQLEPGAALWIRFKLRRGKEQPPLACVVRRVIERDGEYEYGCQFTDSSEDALTVIIRTTIELNIMQAD